LARQLSVTIRATGSAGPIPFNVTGTISTPSLEMSLGADLDLVGGAFEVSVPADAVSASIGTISVSINGVPQALTNLIVSLSQDTIRNRILDALRSYARDQLGALLADFVESLEIPPADLEVPRLGSAGSISLTLETAPSSVEVSDPRALFGFAVRASVVAEHDLPSLGVALPSGPILGDPGSGTPLAFAAQLGALNQILHALWRSGLLHDHVDGSIVAELPPGASAELEALLPPVVAGGDGQTGLVQLGALRVLLTYPGVFDTPVLLSVGAEASVTLATAGDSILLEDVEPVALHVSGVDAALTPIDQALANAIASEILQRLLEAALGAAAEGLSSPAFEPTGLVPFGIPAGSRLGLVDPALELTPTHLYLRGGFGVLEP
jgi:hypothetical protein